MAAVAGVVGLWGVAIEPRLMDVEEETAAIPGLPAEWEGRRIALIADLQVGMWLNNTDTLRRIVTRLVEERPAAVLIAGDFVYEAAHDERKNPGRADVGEFDEVAEVVGILRPLTDARIPVLAVLGNHDYAMMTPQDRRNDRLASHVRAALEAAGVRVLDNAAVPLTASVEGREPRGGIADSPLYVVGVGSRFAGADRPEVALAQVPDGAARVVMMHNPESFLGFPGGTAPFAAAGHTHGGQVRLPFLPGWSWMSVVENHEVRADGWIADYGQAGNRLYVNRGVGFSYAPVRIYCPPELTIFTLRRD